MTGPGAGAVDHTGRIALAVDGAPDPVDLEYLDARVAAFTVASTGHDDPAPLAVLARDDGGQLVGGIHGWTFGRCCELVTLWVDEPERGHGLGSRLLAAAEAEAWHRDCTQVVLLTHAVQAPDLYLRAGYEIVGTVDGYPEGSAALWFRKPRPGVT